VLYASGPSLNELTIHDYVTSDSFMFKFQNFLSILLDIIKEQGRQLEFDGYYISYLLGNITEEEFQEIARDFVTETRETPFDVLKDKVRVLNALRGQDLSIREMAQYLHCSEDDVVRALRLLQG
jgi:hypothetical protein